MTAAIRRALRAWRGRHPSRLARLLDWQRDYEADLARLRPHAPEYERSARQPWGPLDDGRRT